MPMDGEGPEVQRAINPNLSSEAVFVLVLPSETADVNSDFVQTKYSGKGFGVCSCFPIFLS